MDKRALDFLNKHRGLGLSDKILAGVDVSTPGARLHAFNFIVDNYIKKYGGLFGRGDDKLINRLRDDMNKHGVVLDAKTVSLIIDTAVQRIRNWSHLETLEATGTPQIKIYEPIKGCSICRDIHGKIIDVSFAYKGLFAYLNDHSSSIVLLREIPVPPYHLGCHGRFIINLDH